jgi:hypothetical protein
MFLPSSGLTLFFVFFLLSFRFWKLCFCVVLGLRFCALFPVPSVLFVVAFGHGFVVSFAVVVLGACWRAARALTLARVLAQVFLAKFVSSVVCCGFITLTSFVFPSRGGWGLAEVRVVYGFSWVFVGLGVRLSCRGAG